MSAPNPSLSGAAHGRGSGYGQRHEPTTTAVSQASADDRGADVEGASRWYQRVLGATSGHGGPEYEQLLVGGELVMQLHKLEVGHHHSTIGDPAQPTGNGVAIWFEADDFDAAVRRSREAKAQIVADVHDNPNAGHRELWLRDLDGYLVVLAEASEGLEPDTAAARQPS